MMKKLLSSARLTVATLAAAVSILGAALPAAAQTTGYPDATNTGVPAGTALTVVNGNMTITTNGTIVDSKDVRGCITVNASNVIIRKSKVSCSSSSVIWNSGTNLLVEDVQIVCGGMPGTTGLTPGDYTARRVNASACENVFWAESNVTIEDSYLHDPIKYDPVADPHTDTVQLPTGASNITIRHNRIYGQYLDQTNFGNSAITTGGSIRNFIVQDNILAGGGYTVHCDNGGNTNYQVVNNRFSRLYVSTVGGFGPVFNCPQNATQYSGNVYHETGLPLPGQTAPPAAPRAPTNVRIIK